MLWLPNLFYHGILQRSYRKMTINIGKWPFYGHFPKNPFVRGHVAQLVMCLATDEIWLQIQGSWVWSRPGPILSWKLIMKLIIRSFSSLPLNHSWRVVVSYKRKYVHELLVNCPGKSMVRWTDHPAMTIAVYSGRKATKQTNISPLVVGENRLQRHISVFQDAYKRVVEYFGENPRTVSPSTFFSQFVRFVNAFKVNIVQSNLCKTTTQK